ncbi:MAG: hypothetical protein HOO06_05050 [Bdellovibrionaceae bacterium]|jgi:hypothetical protein|nr:hypothetical protein [Pseudobdellovibrionaceae bacterium]
MSIQHSIGLLSKISSLENEIESLKKTYHLTAYEEEDDNIMRLFLYLLKNNPQ